MEIWINPACSKCRTALADQESAEAGPRFPRDPEHRGQWLDGLAAHPRAIQRPIITAADGTTVIGRDADSVATAIQHETG